jgi:hypothetical protein
MDIYLAFVPLVLLLAFLTLRNPSKNRVQQGRPDFVRQASDSIHGPEVPVVSATNTQAPDGVDYNYDVVGESFQRDHLTTAWKATPARSTKR